MRPRPRRLLLPALALLSASALLAQAGLAELVRKTQEALEHYRRHLPQLVVSPYGVEPLLELAATTQGPGATEVRRNLEAAARRLHTAAKRKALELLKQQAGGSPTDEGSYGHRRQLILTFDFIERAFGKRPIYPSNLGQPMISLVPSPNPEHLEKVDGYLKVLAKRRLPPKPDPAPAASSGEGLAGGGDPDDPGGDPSAAPFIPSGHDGETSGATSTGLSVQVDDTPETHRGMELVRWYVLATIGALVLLYLAYLTYQAAKGGKNAMSFLVTAWRQRNLGPIGPEEVPFRKGLKLLAKGKTGEALAVFEAIMEEGGLDSQPARYYALRCYLKQGKRGALHRNFQVLKLDRFSPDELYLLGTSLQEAEERDLARRIYAWLHEKDATFKDVAQRLEALES